MSAVRRGEIWVANLNPNRGKEIGKIRPVLVIQANELTSAGTETVVVLPTTTQIHRQFKYFRVGISARHSLREDTQIIIDQPRTLDKRRFGEGPLTRLTAEEMASVEKGLLAVLGMF